MIPAPYTTLAISLGLGLLVGLQRERGADRVAGVRTFALITLLGTVSAMLSHQLGAWVVVAALLAVVVTTAVATIFQLLAGSDDVGITTEIAIVLMFAIGVLLELGDPIVGVVLGGAVAVLLQLKGPLHRLIDRLADKDVRAIFQFVLLTLVILPVVPDETFGPYDVLNPRNIWLMVVLVTGMSLGGYLAYKLLGSGTSTLLGGLIGGLISSTAATASYSKRAGGGSAALRSIVAAIMLATAVMYARVIVEMSIAAPGAIWSLVWPIVILAGATLAISLGVWVTVMRAPVKLPEQENPTELKAALIFALIYAAVLLLVAWARDMVGDSGTYIVAAVSGVADMDAITLSTARLVQNDQLEPSTAWRAVIVGSIANMAFKTGIAAWLGGSRLGLALGAAFLGSALVGLALILLW
jgi:uncharacterized membrane protein (DUF4010 family)